MNLQLSLRKKKQINIVRNLFVPSIPQEIHMVGSDISFETISQLCGSCCLGYSDTFVIFVFFVLQEIHMVASDMALEVIGDFAIVWLLSPKKSFRIAPTSGLSRAIAGLPAHCLQVGPM